MQCKKKQVVVIVHDENLNQQLNTIKKWDKHPMFPAIVVYFLCLTGFRQRG